MTFQECHCERGKGIPFWLSSGHSIGNSLSHARLHLFLYSNPEPISLPHHVFFFRLYTLTTTYSDSLPQHLSQIQYLFMLPNSLRSASAPLFFGLFRWTSSAQSVPTIPWPKNLSIHPKHCVWGNSWFSQISRVVTIWKAKAGLTCKSHSNSKSGLLLLFLLHHYDLHHQQKLFILNCSFIILSLSLHNHLQYCRAPEKQIKTGGYRVLIFNSMD